jgi:hypothetical protein
MTGLTVSRRGRFNPITNSVDGDFLAVGGVLLGDCRDIASLEYNRAKAAHPENPAFYMRPMFYTGSPFGAEILFLVGGGAA